MNTGTQAAELAAGGDRLREEGKFEEALELYQKLLLLPDARSLAYFKSATVFERCERDSDAEQAYRAALAEVPEYADALNNLGLLLMRARRYDEAEAFFRELLARHPDYANAHINLGSLLMELGRTAEAIYLFRRAVALKPDEAAGHERLGVALKAAGRVREAVRSLRHALQIAPEMAVAWNNLGACHFNLGESEAADAAFVRAIELDGRAAGAWHNRTFLANFMSLDRGEVFQRHCHYGAALRARTGPPDFDEGSNDFNPERRLRIGFVTGDLRRHSVAYFLLAAVRNLDRNSFELAAYSTSPFADDEMTAALRPNFLRWRNLHGLKDDAAVSAIRQDKPDIVFDLSGHAPYNRLELFARRLAPLQISWIGYPNTTGLDTIDYRLSDGVVDPDGDEYHTERLLRLDRPFLCYTPPAEAPEVASPPSLKNGHLTFGSFNARVKLGEECIALWAQVLLANPNSRLLLKSVLGLEELESKRALVDKFVAYGIASERIEVLGVDEDVGSHLATYGRIDIALDSCPYNGTTTTCEAMWMGVPLITLRGDRHASRVGHALLSYLGLEEYCASSAEEFVAITKSLSGDPERLSMLRQTMRERMAQSRLLDGVDMGAALGEILRQAWAERCDVAAAAGMRPAVKPPTELLRLHIGGEQVKEGWKIFNIEAYEGTDFVGDIRDLTRFADESCQEIYASHVLEHIAHGQIVETLRGFHRILSPGGRLYLSVPDLEVLSWLFLRPDFDSKQRFIVMMILFGGQSNPYDFHQVGLNFEFMVEYLQEAGFSSMEQVESFGIFDDASSGVYGGVPISLNLLVEK